MNSFYDDDNDPISNSPIGDEPISSDDPISSTSNEDDPINNVDSTNTRIYKKTPNYVAFNKTNQTDDNSSEKTHSAEEERKANRGVLISLIIFFIGPLLLFILPKIPSVYKHMNGFSNLLLLSTPLWAITYLAFNKAKYPWHSLSKVVMTFFVVIVRIAIALMVLAMFACVSALGASIRFFTECTTLLQSCPG